MSFPPSVFSSWSQKENQDDQPTQDQVRWEKQMDPSVFKRNQGFKGITLKNKKKKEKKWPLLIRYLDESDWNLV